MFVECVFLLLLFFNFLVWCFVCYVNLLLLGYFEFVIGRVYEFVGYEEEVELLIIYIKREILIVFFMYLL